MTRSNLAIDRKVTLGLRAEPDLMVALARSDKVAACFPQYPFELGDEVRHGGVDSSAGSEFLFARDEFERNISGGSAGFVQFNEFGHHA